MAAKFDDANSHDKLIRGAGADNAALPNSAIVDQKTNNIFDQIKNAAADTATAYLPALNLFDRDADSKRLSAALIDSPEAEALRLEELSKESFGGNKFAAHNLQTELEALSKEKPEYIARLQSIFNQYDNDPANANSPILTLTDRAKPNDGHLAEPLTLTMTNGTKAEQLSVYPGRMINPGTDNAYVKELTLDTGIVDKDNLSEALAYRRSINGGNGATSYFDVSIQPPKLQSIVSADGLVTTVKWSPDHTSVTEVDLPDGSKWKSAKPGSNLQLYDKQDQPTGIVASGPASISENGSYIRIPSVSNTYEYDGGIAQGDTKRNGAGTITHITRSDGSEVKVELNGDGTSWLSFTDTQTNYKYTRTANGVMVTDAITGIKIDYYKDVTIDSDGTIIGQRTKYTDIKDLIHFHPGVDPQVQKELIKELQNLPDSIKKKLLDQGTEIEVASPGLSASAGFYDPVKNMIGIASASDFEGESLAHEIAHMLDVQLKITDSSSKFQSIFDSDYANIKANNELSAAFGNNVVPRVDAPENGEGDIYAEIAAGLLGQDQTDDPRRYAKYFPQLTQYIADKLGIPNIYANEPSS